MMFLFQSRKESFGRECSMETAIDIARERVLSVGEEVRLSALLNGRIVYLGLYSPAEDEACYQRNFPEVRCVCSTPFPHGIPLEKFYNAEAWELLTDNQIQYIKYGKYKKKNGNKEN